jgi:hypothetical protein
MLSALSRRARRTADLATRRAARAALVLAALGAAACGDDDDPASPDEHADVVSIRLTITPPAGGAAATYVVTPNGATPSPVQLRVGTSIVTAVPLADGGAAVDADDTADLTLGMSVLPAGVTFVRTGQFAGTLTAATAGATQAQARAELVHDDHADFTAVFPVSVAP